MKTRLLAIIVISLAVFLTTPLAYASFSDSILIYVEGNFAKMYYNEKNIESVTFDPDSVSVTFETRADAELEIKTPIVYKTGPNIFILKNGEEIAPEMTTDDCFFYITTQTKAPEKIEIAYAYWPEYPQTLELCETFDVSPLKQTKMGIPVDEIQCKEGLQKMAKHNGAAAACVTHSTAPKIAERGWSWALDLELWEENYLLIPPTEYVIKIDGVTHGNQYMISGASVDNISYDKNRNSLVVLMNSPERGILQIVVPRGLLHSVTETPFSYAVLADGKEIEFEELSPILLKIMFDSGTERLEIVGFRD